MRAAETITRPVPCLSLHGPVHYGWYWPLLALLAVLLVLGYYAGVLWWGWPRRIRPTPPRVVDVRRLRTSYLTQIQQIESDARSGRADLRAAYQRLSTVVRGYVEGIGALPALAMTHGDLVRAPSPQLAAVVGLMYPPEFAPDSEQQAREQLDEALKGARQVVMTWG